MDMAKIKVVIVENDPENRDLTIEDFTRIDWMDHVKIVENGYLLFHYLDQLDTADDYPSLIIADYLLPGMNGEELYYHLKSHDTYKIIQFAFYDSNVDECLRPRLNKLDVKYFDRPFNIQQATELAQKIKNIALTKSMVS
jgi:CheY-like chemotaxis protein